MGSESPKRIRVLLVDVLGILAQLALTLAARGAQHGRRHCSAAAARTLRLHRRIETIGGRDRGDGRLSMRWSIRALSALFALAILVTSAPADQILHTATYVEVVPAAAGQAA